MAKTLTKTSLLDESVELCYTTWLKHRYGRGGIELGPPTFRARDLFKEENTNSMVLKGGSCQENFEGV